jgi:hypothetical protein
MLSLALAVTLTVPETFPAAGAVMLTVGFYAIINSLISALMLLFSLHHPGYR